MGYGWHDFWTTSPVERAYKKYRDVTSDIEDDVATIRSDLESLRASVYLNVEMYYGGAAGDASSGQFRDGFEQGLDRWKVSANSMVGPIGAFNVALVDLEQKLNLLRSRKSTLSQMKVNEDAREREYTQAEIPF